MRLSPISDILGVEVTHFDVCAPTSAHDGAVLRRAFDEYHLLLFRGQRVDPDRHVELTSLFGPPVDDLGEGHLWTIVSNSTNAGAMELTYHADYTYTDEPVKGISMHALDVPSGGATTSFVNAVAAWKSAPDRLRDRVASLSARHSYRPSVLPGETPPPIASATHPIRLLHPRTNQPVLFVTDMATKSIEGLPADESAKLLAELFEHLYSGAHTHEHKWQLNDLVIWDNLALQHAREQTNPAAGARTFQRVCLNTRPYADLIPGVLGAQRAFRERAARTS
jgi:taurine dioxygenase